MRNIILKVMVMLFGLFLINFGYVILHPTVWWDGLFERSSAEDTFIVLMFVNVVFIEIMRRWVKREKKSLDVFAVMGVFSLIFIMDRIVRQLFLLLRF